MVCFLKYTGAALAVISTAIASPTSATVDARKAPLIPNGKKAGSAGGRAMRHWKDHIGWWYDWTPKPSGHDEVMGVSMLRGRRHQRKTDADRLRAFQILHETPLYLLGLNEPDCPGKDSADLRVAQGGRAGSLLGSPSMCKQKDEGWLAKFRTQSLDADWDLTAIHSYKDSIGRPARSSGRSTTSSTTSVDLFEKNEHVMAYAYTGGGGLAPNWLPTNGDGSQLSESGGTYLNAITKYN
ncbi:hypothetical protein ISF_00199 [Cordyceps fumosorosea ARSEF 2679]|uniref:Asl1-like glycosyl hydrolase catalytic domain-containing protein n=1 Tax=Cordyceps fumosorosea (strain ARSEF 2679) TaxID=1081104 RepID=A0A168E2G0_CORFA|nr:hypothetical protein ISF_00199 [Cordyceps fumosorosea ARSEF 2679]OAA73298.1 hypothetical protein ISF_00199 [Cordyceps fumosorosea ARSEF 2679]